MGLQEKLMAEIKTAMKSKDKIALESLRAIKSEILLAKTKTGTKEELTESEELKIVQKLAKQRRDSAILYIEQNREDLAKLEQEQLVVIERFLPKQLTEEELKVIILKIIKDIGATSPKDMGKTMGAVNKQLQGKADGRLIASIVKEILNSL